jgi:hypothetical protein
MSERDDDRTQTEASEETEKQSEGMGKQSEGMGKQSERMGKQSERTVDTSKRTDGTPPDEKNVFGGTGEQRTERRPDDETEIDSASERAARTDPETTAGTASESETTATRTAPDDPDDPAGSDYDDGGGLSGGAAIVVSAMVALVVTTLAYLWASGWFGGWSPEYETLFRVAPTVSGGGVGTDWVTGNTVPILDAAIAITHAADVLMGVLILVMVFLHWSIFRRLSTRIRSPSRRRTSDTVATDGGARGETNSQADDESSDDGEANPRSESAREGGDEP